MAINPVHQQEIQKNLHAEKMNYMIKKTGMDSLSYRFCTRIIKYSPEIFLFNW